MAVSSAPGTVRMRKRRYPSLKGTPSVKFTSEPTAYRPPMLEMSTALDPPGGSAEAEFISDQRQCHLRAIGGEARGPEGALGVPRGYPEEPAGLPPLRRHDGHPPPSLLGEPLRHHFAILQCLRHNHLVGNIRHAIVIPFHQRGEDLAGLRAKTDQGEGLLADHPAAPDEECGDLRQVVFPVETEHIPVPARRGNDPLFFQGLLDGRNPIADGGRLLEPEELRRIVHPGAEVADQRLLPAFEKCDAVLYQPPIGIAFDPADAGGAAAADLVFDARAAAGIQFPIPAAPEGNDRLEEAEGFPGSAAGGIGTEIAGAVFLLAPHKLKPRKGLLRIDADVEIGLVIPEIDVVPGPVLLDQVVLKDQRLLFRPGDDERHIPDPGNEERDHRPGVGPGEVGPDPGPQIPGLPHVEDLPCPVLHEIDAGAPGGVSDCCVQLRAHRLQAVIIPSSWCPFSSAAHRRANRRSRAPCPRTSGNPPVPPPSPPLHPRGAQGRCAWSPDRSSRS